jgi:hypothetical protein
VRNSNRDASSASPGSRRCWPPLSIPMVTMIAQPLKERAPHSRFAGSLALVVAHAPWPR